ncbi:MAG: hypothetical protein QXV88_06575 [Candidatus Bathyarchaeia archaeon]
MARSRRKRYRDMLRLAYWVERRLMLNEAFWDRRAAELIAVKDYPSLNVFRGEVLFDRRGYVNPSLLRKGWGKT